MDDRQLNLRNLHRNGAVRVCNNIADLLRSRDSSAALRRGPRTAVGTAANNRHDYGQQEHYDRYALFHFFLKSGCKGTAFF